MFIENGFYQSDLICVDGEIYIGVNRLLEAMKYQDVYGFPIEDMTCPRQCGNLDSKEVFRNIEEGYLVLGRIQYGDQILESKFILNKVQND